MSFATNTTFILTGLNFVLTLILAGIYARTAWRIRAAFPLGLLILALLFLIQNAVALYQYATMMQYLAPGLEPFALTFAAIQAVAFSLMLWLAMR